MKGVIFILNIFNSIKYFIQRNKSYIIIFLIFLISVISLVIQNIKEKDTVVINNNKLEKNEYEGKIAVYIAGEVKKPGVYYIEENTRLDDLIKECGGFTDNADISELNLAEKLNDSDKIEVPKITKEDVEDEESNDVSESDLVNINTASVDELKTLKGIGDTLANNIIEYRKNNKFSSIEDILNVNGIGKSKFEAIKEYICVN